MNKRNSALLQRGAAMVELALVLPILMLILFGFIEVGRALYQQNTLTKAISTGARFISRAPDGVTASCQPGATWQQTVDQARALITYPGTSGRLLLNGLEDDEALVFSVRQVSAVCVIRIEANLAYVAIAGIIPILNNGGIALNATVEERYIGD